MMSDTAVLCILAEGFEEIEAVTTIDLLRRAQIPVTVAGLGKSIIHGSHQISIKCDTLFENTNADQFTHLFLPGGQPGTNNLRKDKSVIDFIRRFHDVHKTIAAICAAPTVLHEAGIIKNMRITSYPGEKEVFDSSKYSEDDVVHDKNVITSRGVGTTIKFALYLIEQIMDKETSRLLAHRILFSDY